MISKYIVAKSTSVYCLFIKSLKSYPLIYLFLICFKFKLYRHATNIKNKFFASHFLNVNISVTIKHRPLKFSVLILNIIREGTVSQISHITLWPNAL